MSRQRALPPTALRILRGVAFLAGLVPLAILIQGYLTETLSVNPLDDITDTTGTWTLRFLVITLAITPLRKLTGWTQLARFRKMAGVYAFFYGTLHLFTYLYFDKFFYWEDVLLDIPQRRFILVGFAAWAIMLPLAVTSINRISKWMGGKRWRILHRAAYLVGLLGVVHYYWLVKFDTSRPIVYGIIIASLLLFRVGDVIYTSWRKRRTPGTPA